MKKIRVLIIILSLSLYFPVSSESDIVLTHENTVILSNETDKSFCKDFSPFLRKLSLDWVAVENLEKVKGKNLIILGGPDAEGTKSIVRELITQKEADYIRKNHYSILLKENPWTDNQVIYVCAGADRVFTKKAAEKCLSLIIKNAQNPEKWVYHSLKNPQEIQEYIAPFRFIPDDKELPKDALDMDVNAEIPEYITVEEALEDIEYLFYLLSHGYSGYGYFRTKGDFEQAKKNIVTILKTRSSWSTRDFSQVIYNDLNFIHDSHFLIGYHHYSNHYTFWYSTTVELSKTNGEYSFVSDNTSWKVLTVNSRSPQDLMYPSLNAQGDPVYILGVLSQFPPEPLVVTATDGQKQKQFKIQVHHSDFGSTDIFKEESCNKIPVVTIRSFSDSYTVELERTLQTAEKYKGEQYLILDIRGNRGGNKYWPETWIKRFTGQIPEWYFAITRFVSRTIFMGYANWAKEAFMNYPEISAYKKALDYYEEQVDSFEKKSETLYWLPDIVQLPPLELIPNATTLIVLTDGEVASAGEGFIGYLHQVENVIFVGENSRGAVVFGDVGLYQLPNSNLPVELGSTLNFSADLDIMEEKGFFPDLWIPAEYALSYVLEAVKKGII
jgi:hypothetical protein